MTKKGRAHATVNGTSIAETEQWEEVEGNIYFPPAAIRREYFVGPTGHSTHCPWKGDASYYHVKVGDTQLDNAAWCYPETKDEAKHIKHHVAFYTNKVTVASE